MNRRLLFATISTTTLLTTLVFAKENRRRRSRIRQNVLPNCRSDLDYGWPRFESMEELRDEHPKWATYYRSIYGELPNEYPVCVYDLHYINRTEWFRAGLNGSRPVLQPTKELKDGDLYYQFSTTTSNTSTVDYGIFHSKWSPVPNDTWVEISHAVYPSEVHGMWVRTTFAIDFSTSYSSIRSHFETLTYVSSYDTGMGLAGNGYVVQYGEDDRLSDSVGRYKNTCESDRVSFEKLFRCVEFD